MDESPWGARGLCKNYGRSHTRSSTLFTLHTSPKGKRIINLLGSKGNKGVALALLGSDVTVVDISASNAKYANELADAAGVSIQYVVSDVLNVQLSESFDIVLLELGVLHYFLDLKPLFQKLLLYLSEMECLYFVTIILFTQNY